MKKKLAWSGWLSLAVVCLMVSGCSWMTVEGDCSSDAALPAPDGFAPLFNGRDLAGWRGVTSEGGFDDPATRRALMPESRWALQDKADVAMRRHWRVSNGVLLFDGLGDAIAAERHYGNFEAVVDWRLPSGGRVPGFGLRGMPQEKLWARMRPAGKDGTWNRTRIRLVGDRVWAWLNDVPFADGVRLENVRHPDKGIALIDNFELQGRGDPVAFRNVFIRELPEAAEDIPDPAHAVRGERINLLREGLAGWKAADPTMTMGWSVKEGVLSNYVTSDPTRTSRGGSGGTHLMTVLGDFLDFDLSYDVLVPPKCNSGVYLRGRYEIQVVDSYGKAPDCHQMAALYDLIAPRVSAEKPAGEWQHVDLTIYRRHLTVVLNGIRIIDNQPIGGVTPGALDGDEFVSGPILLQGDHSNASFRNMILTRIVR